MITAGIFIKPRRRISDVGQIQETDMMPLLEEQLKLLHGLLVGPAIINLDETAYNSRKIIKKIRALLLIVKNHIPRSVYDETDSSLAFISKELAPVREIAVLIQTSAIYKQDILNTAGAVHYTRLEHQLEDMHHQLNEKFVENGSLSVLRSHLDRLKILTGVPAIFLENKYIEEEIGKTYKRCRKLFNSLTIASSSKQYHHLRICSKSLQNQLGIMNKAGLGRIRIKSKLDKINHLLGIKNDLNVFIKYLKINSKDIYRQTSPFFKKEIRSMRRKILQEAGEYY